MLGGYRNGRLLHAEKQKKSRARNRFNRVVVVEKEKENSSSRRNRLAAAKRVDRSNLVTWWTWWWLSHSWLAGVHYRITITRFFLCESLLTCITFVSHRHEMLSRLATRSLFHCPVSHDSHAFQSKSGSSIGMNGTWKLVVTILSKN